MGIFLSSDYHLFHNRDFIYKARGFECVENMNEEIVDTAKRFSRIINMASIDLAGFEINRKENTVYFTSKFAEI